MRNPLRRRLSEIPDIDIRASDVGVALAPRPRITSMPVTVVDYGVDYAQPPSGAASGVDGDSWYWQAISGGPDINPEMMGRQKYEIYYEMKLTDPAVRSLLYMFKLPIRAASWKIEAASEDGIDELICDAAAWQFGLNDEESRLDLTWDEQLQQILHILDYGAQGEEMIWGDPETWHDDEGGERIIRPLMRLAPRAAATIDKIETDKVTGEITRSRQDVPGADWMPGIVRVKGGGTEGKFAWMALERENGSWWGQSQLRAAYGPWLLKKGLQVASGIGWDRFSGGVPLVRYPKSGTTADRDKAEEIGRNYRTHERAWVTLEGTKEEGWDFEIVNGALTLMDPVPLLRHYDQQIAMNGLQQFSSLGTTETGSRAVGEVLSDPYYLALQALAKSIIEHRRRSVWRRWVDVNFGPRYKVPNLSVSKIQGRNIAVLARAVADLSTASLAFTDRDTQNDIRDILDLRHMPEELSATIQDLPEDIGIRPVPAPPAIPREGDAVPAA